MRVDIESLREKLYTAMDSNDKNEVLRISQELDKHIVNFMRRMPFKKELKGKHIFRIVNKGESRFKERWIYFQAADAEKQLEI